MARRLASEFSSRVMKNDMLSSRDQGCDSTFAPVAEQRSTRRFLPFAQIALQRFPRRGEFIAQRLEQRRYLEFYLRFRKPAHVLAAAGEALRAHARRRALHRVQMAVELADIACRQGRLDLREQC